MSAKVASSSTKLKKLGADTSADGKHKHVTVSLTVKLTDTGETFQLKNISITMTIKNLKGYLEFVAGIPVFLQRLHYLDESKYSPLIEL